MRSKDNVGAVFHKVLADRKCLDVHPFGSRPGRRQVGDIVPETASFYHFRKGYKDAAIINAGTGMKDWRNPDSFTYRLQSRTGPFVSLWSHCSALGARRGGTSCLYY